MSIPDSQPITVLLVEDDSFCYILTEKMLSRASTTFTIQWCDGYDSAFEAISSSRFDICLMDYTLGERSGIELLKQIRAAGNLMPVIMLTGHSDQEIDLEAMNAGADDYLVKGEFDVRLLERSIRYAIERRRGEAEQQKAKTELRESRQLFQTFMDNTPALAFIKDSSRRYHFVNQKAAEIFGTTIEFLLGKTTREHLSEETASLLDAMETEVLAKQESIERVECIIVNNDEHYLLLQCFPITDARGSILIGTTGIEITKQKQAERSLQEAHDKLELRVAERTAALQETMTQLEHAHAQQKRFVADASHDIRTPLTIIRGELELLLECPQSGDQLETTLRGAISEIDRLDLLASDLLLLARYDNATRTVIADSCRLDELLLDAIAGLSVVAREKNISWQIDIDEAVEIECDERTMKRAINNVLENAVKYSPDESLVQVALHSDGTVVRISVVDCGVGISSEDLPRVFDRFYRGDSTRSTEGTGLGLAIVKSVMEAHNGFVRVDSELGRGTKVVLSLPMSVVHLGSE
jgi:PAS domain S-box-containing protein